MGSWFSSTSNPTTTSNNKSTVNTKPNTSAPTTTSNNKSTVNTKPNTSAPTTTSASNNPNNPNPNNPNQSGSGKILKKNKKCNIVKKSKKKVKPILRYKKYNT